MRPSEHEHCSMFVHTSARSSGEVGAITSPASSTCSTSLRQAKPIWSFQISQIARTLINLLPPSQRKLIKIARCELEEFLREMRSLTKSSSGCRPSLLDDQVSILVNGKEREFTRIQAFQQEEDLRMQGVVIDGL